MRLSVEGGLAANVQYAWVTLTDSDGGRVRADEYAFYFDGSVIIVSGGKIRGFITKKMQLTGVKDVIRVVNPIRKYGLQACLYKPFGMYASKDVKIPVLKSDIMKLAKEVIHG